jgi:hypothetical protein
MSPEQLRDEASASEAAAAKMSPGPDRDWLMAKAETLRHEAERLEQRLDVRADLLSPNPPPASPAHPRGGGDPG